MIQERRESFAKEMQAKRKRSGKSCGEVAQIIGVSAVRIAHLERGFANWSPGMIRAYNNATGGPSLDSEGEKGSTVYPAPEKLTGGGCNERE